MKAYLKEGARVTIQSILPIQEMFLPLRPRPLSKGRSEGRLLVNALSTSDDPVDSSHPRVASIVES